MTPAPIVFANVGCANPLIQGLFRSCSFLGCWFLAVTLVKAIDASRGIDQLLLTGKERVAGGTDFHVQIAFFRRTRLEGLAASAANSDFSVFRVNSRFHLLSFSRCSIWTAQGLKFKRTMIGGGPEARQAA